MERKAFSAVFLSIIMLLSGCLGAEEEAKEVVEVDAQEDVFANLTLSMGDTNPTVGDIVVIEGLVEIDPIGSKHSFEYDLITPSGIRQLEITFSETDTGI